MSRVLPVVLAGVVLLAGSSSARAGFISVVLTAGADGSSTPSASNTFQFTNPTGSPLVGISDLVGVGSVQANTAGGSAFFGGLGLPIVLNVSDGTAVVSSGAPAGAVPSTGLASAAPTAPNTIPTDAAILSASLGGSADGGPQVLSVSVTNGVGSTLSSGTVTVPVGGWWVIGLTPGGDTPPVVVPPVIVPPVVTPPVVVPPTTPPTAATPEPATLVLAGLGLPLVGMVRLIRKRRSLA